MAIKVQLYAFAKKPNSTKRPVGEGVTYECVLKDNCTIVNPVIRLQLQMTENPTVYNYAIINDFKRYYYVNDWEYDGRLWNAHLTCDALASFKAEIGNSTQYILRSSAQYDGNITDMAAPLSGESIIDVSYNAKPEGYGWSGKLDEGSYVVGIYNSSQNAIGAVAYYTLTPAQMRHLCNKMLANPAYLGIQEEELSTGLQEALFNPWQYIASVVWYPFTVARGNPVSSIDFGWWNYDVEGYTIASYGYSLNEIEFTIPKHPQYTEHGEYMNREPFSRYALFVPGFGEFDVPAQYLSTEDKLSCQIVTDSITGVATMTVKDISGNIIAIKTAQIGVPIAIGYKSYNDTGAALTSAASKAIFDWSRTLGLSLGAESSVGTASAAIADSMSNFSTVGTNGTLSQYYYPPRLTGYFLYQKELPIEEAGRPSYQEWKISDIPGYIQCLHGDVSTLTTATEKQEIKAWLEGGFYYE